MQLGCASSAWVYAVRHLAFSKLQYRRRNPSRYRIPDYICWVKRRKPVHYTSLPLPVCAAELNKEKNQISGEQGHSGYREMPLRTKRQAKERDINGNASNIISSVKYENPKVRRGMSNSHPNHTSITLPSLSNVMSILSRSQLSLYVKESRGLSTIESEGPTCLIGSSRALGPRGIVDEGRLVAIPLGRLLPLNYLHGLLVESSTPIDEIYISLTSHFDPRS